MSEIISMVNLSESKSKHLKSSMTNSKYIKGKYCIYFLMGFGFNCFGGISCCLHFRDQMSVSLGFFFFPCYVVGFSSFVGYNYVSIGRLLVPIYIFVIKMVMVRWGNAWKKKKLDCWEYRDFIFGSANFYGKIKNFVAGQTFSALMLLFTCCIKSRWFGIFFIPLDQNREW